MTYRAILIVAILAAWTGGGAFAQPAPVTNIRGTIAAVDEHSLTIATREGPSVKMALKDDTRVGSVKALEMSAIKTGSFVGIAAEPGANGQLRALEVLVFPEALRGTGEGHRDWDLKPGSSMTNATVAAVVEGMSGRDLELTYKGGSVKIAVPPGTPIITPAPADRSDLKPGAAVFAAVTGSGADLTALRISVAKYGIAPPM